MNKIAFLHNADHNQVIKLDGLQLVMYQIKKYESGRIEHRYTSTAYPTQERLQAEWGQILEKMNPCTEKVFQVVVADYYNKEKENAGKARRRYKNIESWEGQE